MRIKLSFLVSGLALMLPGLAQPAAVGLNGTCWVGNCSSPDTIGAGTQTGGSLNSTYTLANGDMFQVTGTYGSSYNSDGTLAVALSPTAVYLGNKTNMSAASQADMLTFNIWQTFNYTSGSLAGFYGYYFISDTSGPIAPSSTYTGNLALNGTFIGAVTVGTGYSGTNGFNQGCFDTAANCTSYGFPSLGVPTNPLTEDQILTLSFGAGSGVGAAIATVTPEPSSGLLLSIGGLGLAAAAVFGRRKLAAAKLS